jgi:hypothetical protein
MRPAGKAKTVAYVSGGFLALTVAVGGAAVALTHTDPPPSRPAAVGGTTPPTPRPLPSGSAVTSQHAAGASDAALKIGPLHKLTPPDAIVKLQRPAGRHAVSWLRRQPGVHRVVVVDRGVVRVRGVALRALGVPLSSIRSFTPSLSASSLPLWQSVARGEVTVSYAKGRHLRRHLGQTYVAHGRGSKSAALRIGAFATIGLDGTEAIVSQPAARSLGLGSRLAVLVAAPKLSLDTLTADLRKAFGRKAKLDITRAATVDQSVISSYAAQTIPATYLDLYRRAAVTCPGLPWTVLAGIGTVETANGTNVHKSTAGAIGPMQFIPSTWAMYGYDADGDGRANIHNPTDSVFSAARYLCAAGAGLGGQSLDNAIFSYNHAWWYVREVINIANSYV